MSLSTDWAIFSPAIAGNPFYARSEGNWWVLKVKFPRRSGTYCENQSYWNVSSRLSLRKGEFGNNTVCTHRSKCAPTLKGAAESTKWWFDKQSAGTETADVIGLENCKMVSCLNDKFRGLPRCALYSSITFLCMGLFFFSQSTNSKSV